MSNYITEAFKQLNLLESEDISLDASGIEELRSFLDDAAVDPDEEMDIYDLEAEAKEDLQKSYEGKVVLECTVCHSHIFEDKENISMDDDGEACKDIECPYCMSNEGYFIIGEIAPFDQEMADSFDEEEDELDEVDIEGAADDIDDEDIIEEGFIGDINIGNGNSLNTNTNANANASVTANDNDIDIPFSLGKKGKKEPVSESRKSRRSRRSLKEATESPEKIMQALDRASRNNSNILIQPSPGRNTINTIYKWCKDNGYFCKVTDAMMMEPEDLGGIISRSGNRADRLQSQFMSEISELDDRNVLVLDNLNRAPQEIQGALLSVIEKLPCMVVGILVGNSSLDSAMKSRFYKVEVNESCNKNLKEAWDEEFESEYDAIMDDPSLSKAEKDRALSKLYSDYGMNESMKLDGVEELYDNDEIRGVEELEGVDKLKGVKELHGDKHEAPINESKKKTSWVISSDVDGEICRVDSEREAKATIAELKREDKKKRKNKKVEYSYELQEGFGGAAIGGSIGSMVGKAMGHPVLGAVGGAIAGSTIQNNIKKNNDSNQSLEEGIEDISVTTEDETMTMTTKEDGGVVIETSPKEPSFGEEDFGTGEEMIVPISDESSEVIDVATDALDSEDEEDFEAIKDEMEESEEEPSEDEDFEEFDEESFNGHGESYLRRCYENVKSFRTTNVSSKGKKLFIEGVIKFDSGNIKETQFVFESLGKGKFEGYNKQISRGKKTYKLAGSVKNNKLVCESLNYNYRSKNELNESVRVYGTVKRK